jgi:glycosyltransferase involved in cell wall biosynthesis
VSEVLLVQPRATGGLAAHVAQEEAVLTAAGVRVRRSAARIGSRPSLRADARAAHLLRSEMQTSAPDAGLSAHAHGLRAGALAVLVRRSLPRPARDRIRVVVTLHNRIAGSLPTRGLGTGLLRVIRHGADAVLAVSPDLALAVRGACHVESAVIPATPATDETGVADDPGRQDIAVLVVARLAPQKGLDVLLDAVSLLVAEGDAPEVLIAGDGPLREHLRGRIRAEQLPVHLLGHREDVPVLLRRCRLVVSAALWEGQPVFLQEALHAHRAILATDAGGTSLVTGEAGHLVPVGDAPALARGIRTLLDPAARSAAEKLSRQRATQLPTDRDLYRQLVRVLEISEIPEEPPDANDS